jgi:hypothetical protein
MSPRKCFDASGDEVRLAEVVERLGSSRPLVVVLCAWKADELKDVPVEPGGDRTPGRFRTGRYRRAGA